MRQTVAKAAVLSGPRKWLLRQEVSSAAVFYKQLHYGWEVDASLAPMSP